MRSLIVDIYPPDFADVTFESALTDLLDRASDRGLGVGLHVDLRDPLPDAAARLLYRTAQEGIRNTLEHADAHRVDIDVRQQDNVAILEVSDDGHGFAADELGSRKTDGHLGLVALRGLASDAGGRLDVQSVPGQGTTLRVEYAL